MTQTHKTTIRAVQWDGSDDAWQAIKTLMGLNAARHDGGFIAITVAFAQVQYMRVNDFAVIDALGRREVMSEDDFQKLIEA